MMAHCPLLYRSTWLSKAREVQRLSAPCLLLLLSCSSASTSSVDMLDGGLLDLIGQRPASFAVAVNFPVATSPSAVAAGDFNADGKPDLIVANAGTNNVSVLLNNGMGGFAFAANFAVSTAPISVAVADVIEN